MESAETSLESPNTFPEAGASPRPRPAIVRLRVTLAIILVLVVGLAFGLLAALSGPQPVVYSEVSFAGPSGWRYQPPTMWNLPGSENLLFTVHDSNRAWIMVIRLPFWGTTETLETSVALITRLALGSPSFTITGWRSVGNQRALEAEVSLEHAALSASIVRIVYVVYQRHLYGFALLATDRDALTEHGPEFDTLLNSVTFTPAEE